MKKCPNPTCNYSNLPDDSIFCTECGTGLGESQTPPPPPPPPPKDQTPSEQTPPPPPPKAQQVGHPILQLPDNTSIPIDSDAKVFGRNELLAYLSSLQADPKVVSRQHFSIIHEGDKYFIEDGDTIVQDKPSTNHTFLNGEDITGKGKKELTNGTVIDIANTVNVTFRIQ